MVEVLFWMASFLIIYTYFLYPGILYFASALQESEDVAPKGGALPFVSVIISAYNEKKIIKEKLDNLFGTDYPFEKIEFIVGSDGSNDGTNEILQKTSSRNFRPFLFAERRGKAVVVNELMTKAQGDIIVFSDANTFYTPQTVGRLVERFSDENIGGVCGELVLESDMKTGSEKGELSYWKYETFLKGLESRIRTILGATGGVYAIRKSLFSPLPTNKGVTDDLLIPLEIARKGSRVVYEPSALAFEKTTGFVADEFRRKVRIGAQVFNTLSEFSGLLSPRYGFVSFALWSHKILRWIVPFLLLMIFGTNLFLAGQGLLYQAALWFQFLFYALALLGFIFERVKLHIKSLTYPYYFVSMNAALLVGFLKSMTGGQTSTWDVKR
jgi:cellulose synthase/poly-beta-1,6-N-acetylglucosamine synthase-like glycosyltransferase